MRYFSSVETPGFTVTIHRGDCEFCLDGSYRAPTFSIYLSWSNEFGTYEDVQEHVRKNFSFFKAPIDCSACKPNQANAQDHLPNEEGPESSEPSSGRC